MPSIPYRRCQRIIEILLREKNYMVNDIIRWSELKEIIELEVAGDPRTLELYRKRLLKWHFLTKTRQQLYKINPLDPHGHPITTQTQVKSTMEALKNALEVDTPTLQIEKDGPQRAKSTSDNPEPQN